MYILTLIVHLFRPNHYVHQAHDAHFPALNANSNTSSNLRTGMISIPFIVYKNGLHIFFRNDDLLSSRFFRSFYFRVHSTHRLDPVNTYLSCHRHFIIHIGICSLLNRLQLPSQYQLKDHQSEFHQEN